MLLYLINVVDNTWLLALLAPLAIWSSPGGRSRGKIVRRAFLSALGLGLLSALIYSILRRNTGWVIREFYALGVLVPAISGVFALIVSLAAAGAQKKLGAALIFGRAALSIMAASIIYVALWYFFGLKGAFYLIAFFLAIIGALSLGPLKISDPFWPLLLSASMALAAVTARVAPSLMLYPLDFGVGLDSVFNVEYLAKTAGYLMGLLVMALLWLSVGFICRQAPKRAAKLFALAALIVIFAQLSLEAGQILAARRLIPRFWFRVVLWLLEREGAFFWIQAGLWGLLAVSLMVRSRLILPAGANPALRRKARASLRSDFRAGAVLAMSLFLVLFTATALRAVSRRGPVIAEPTLVAAQGERLVMDLEPLADGNLHRLAYNSKTGTPVRFIVIKKSQSAYGVGLDACDICGQSGYYQRGDQVICKLCDVVMNKSTIGFPGGCNPVPLAFELSEGKMVIKTGDLDSEAYRFE